MITNSSHDYYESDDQHTTMYANGSFPSIIIATADVVEGTESSNTVVVTNNNNNNNHHVNNNNNNRDMAAAKAVEHVYMHLEEVDDAVAGVSHHSETLNCLSGGGSVSASSTDSGLSHSNNITAEGSCDNSTQTLFPATTATSSAHVLIHSEDWRGNNTHHRSSKNNNNNNHHHGSNHNNTNTNKNNKSNKKELRVQLSHEQRLAAAHNELHRTWPLLGRHWYPEYHMAAYAGWMSVPGGLCFHDGFYHAFYQHHPFSENWGPMHWGHLTSINLVDWHHEEVALAPGDAFDADGCFSGSSVSFEGKMYIFYTGHSWGKSSGMSDRGIYQQQCLAVSEDGVHFEKLGVVVRPPKGYTHFRDPKVWRQGRRWFMVCGARDAAQDVGQLLLYSSESLLSWDESAYTIVSEADDKNIFMWECPDFFPSSDIATMGGTTHALRPSANNNNNNNNNNNSASSYGDDEDDTASEEYTLIFSPQGMRAEGHQFRNRFQTGYLSLHMNKDTFQFEPSQTFKELDRGHDFYAPQTLMCPDGRRIIIGWLDMWESPMPTKEHGWSGSLSLPRELVRSPYTNKILMVPPRELLLLRGEQAVIPPQELAENSELPLVEDCTAYEVEVSFNLDTASAEKYGLWLGRGCEIYVDAQANTICVSRHYPEWMLSGYRCCPLPASTVVTLRIFFDRSSVEVFVNNGEAVLSSRIYPAEEGDRALRLFSVGGRARIVQGTVWQMRSTISH